MKKEIKSILEIVPLLLVLESILCFFLSYFEFYKHIYETWENITGCSFLMCLILYVISEDWGLLAKKCIGTLFMLNGLNLIYGLINTEKYYLYFQTIIYLFGVFLIIHELCRKK